MSQSLNYCNKQLLGKPSQGFSRASRYPKGEDLRWGTNMISTPFQTENTAHMGLLRSKQFLNPKIKLKSLANCLFDHEDGQNLPHRYVTFCLEVHLLHRHHGKFLCLKISEKATVKKYKRRLFSSRMVNFLTKILIFEVIYHTPYDLKIDIRVVEAITT